MRILLVEDTAAYREEFKMLLADAGIAGAELDFAVTWAEGARQLALNAHDVYVVDYRLPGNDGLLLVRNARASGMTAPIIVLTAFNNPALDKAAEEAGATDYLPKGEFSPQILGRAIRYAIRNAAALQAARQAEARFRMAQDVAGIGTFDWDIRANTKIWSPTMWKLYGLDPDRDGPLTYATWRNAIHPDDVDRAQAALADAVVGDAPYDLRFRVIRRDSGAPVARWIAAKGDVLRDPAGSPVRMLGINIDITDQHNTMAALQAARQDALAGLKTSETRFKTYFDNAIETLFCVRPEPDGAFRYEIINGAGLRYLGKPLDQVVGRTPVDVLGPDGGGRMTEALRHVLETGENYRYEPVHDLPGGTTIFDAVYTPLRNEAGEITGILGSARDLTERRRLEDSLRQSQKMEALGQLAGGIAHDFNNLLTGMLGCFELLARQAATDRGKRLAGQGIRAVERGTALTARLLAFARQQPLTAQPTDVNGSLDDITDMLTRTIGADVRIGKVYAPDLWLAQTDRNQLELAILNLGINARDAMPAGGRLTVTTSNETVTEPRDGLVPGDYVAVAITDSGTGMSPEVLARVTEPFFTTKPHGKGTGLGLSMVAGVVKQLGGGLSIVSEVGKGTSVTLFLPRAVEVAATGVSDDARAASVEPSTLLVVDDDTSTQAAIAAFAAEAGHTVVPAASARDALALLNQGRAIDMMVIDVTLPGISGMELATAASRLRPGLPVLFISGQTTLPVLHGIPMLAKPFRQDAFDGSIAALLGKRRDPSNVVPLRGANGQ